MADYNTFLVVDCNTRRPILITSSARKAYKELKTGIRIEVWNNNSLVERIYEADRANNPMSAYIRAEREYIGRKQAQAELRNKRRRERLMLRS